MKHRLLLIFLVTCLGSLVLGQPYGNEWIDYNQPHFKFEVSEEGIHRIGSNVINQYGLNFIDADNFKLFRDGQEVPIYVSATNNVAQYIEFYAYPNDGKLDTRLFRDPDWQLHDRFSLFYDKASYYLTWNETGGNERINDTPNNLNNPPAKEDYFWHTSREIFTSTFSVGEPTYLSSTALYNSIFGKGEGYYSNQEFNNSTTTRSYNLATPQAVAGIDAELYTVVVGWTANSHNFHIKTGPVVLSTHLFSNFDVVKTQNIIPSNFIGNSTNVTFEAIPTSSGTNRNNASLIEIAYARGFDFDNQNTFSFKLEGNGNQQYIEIEDLNDEGARPILYDATNGYRIESADPPGSNSHRFVLPPALGERQLVVRANSSSSYTNVSSMEQLAFVNFDLSANQGDYIILTGQNYINSAEVNSYVNHRESMSGGQHEVVKVDIQQLYDQFAFGVDHHPQSVRGFIDYISDTWTPGPEYIFIIGKGREYKDFRFNQSIRDACIVPTFGNPGSDILLAADTSSSIPKISIGRLAAINLNQIDDYYQKIVQYDDAFYNFGDPYQTVASKDYMKHIIHLGGGTSLAEQNLFRNYLGNYEATASGTSWGAAISSVYKNSSAPIQTLPSERIRNRINEGVSLITFFGHSYAGGFDISFDDPENYTNVGKYPIFVANGCNSGLIHAGSQSISERFVLEDQKGAIAYLSTTDYSASSSLNKYTGSFYNNMSNTDYGKSLGAVIKQTVEDVENCCSNSAIDMMIAQEMTLHGDPAIPLNQYNEPDYAMEAQNVIFNPGNVTTSSDSFEMQLIVYNLGKAINDSIDIEVTRIFPNGNQDVQVKRFHAPYHIDTFSFTLPVSNDNNGLGLNNFNIYLDVNDDVANELSETNNYLLNAVELFIGSDDIFPIHPYEFAIVPQAPIELKSSTGNPFEEEKWYVYQIDTSELFLNPLAEERIYTSGGVVKWIPPITYQDSTVYYWRVSVDSSYSGNYKWRYSSFIYIPNEFPGWNQSHYYQWQKDSYSNVYLDTDRDFQFIDVPKGIYVKTGRYPVLFYEEMEWKMDGAQMHNWKMNNCGGGVGFPNGLSIAVIDNVTGVAVPIVNNSTTSSYGPFGNIHCRGIEDVITVANFRAFGNTPSNHPTPGVPWSDLIIDYLNNVPDDFYILVYSINNVNYPAWDGNLINYLNGLSCPVSNATPGPMIFAYQKNNASFPAIVNFGQNWNDIITNTFEINGIWTSGHVKSTLIGPALEWGSFHWRYGALENPTTDEQSVNIYGVNGNVETLLMNVPASTLDTSINTINATQYPYLRLQLLTNDLVDRTPSQLDYWRILFNKPPEAAVNPLLYFSVNKDTLMQGETWEIAVAIENVTDVAMDSLTVKQQLTTASNNLTTSFVELDSLRAFDTLVLRYDQNTINGFNGLNKYSIEANPYEQNHQLEQFHFNNFANLSFLVEQDDVNPLLDVSFDGRKILDGDLVSAKPEILIQLKDDNQFLALDDTSLINLYFRYLGIDGNSPEGLTRVSYLDPRTQFIPATLNNSNNEARVVLNYDFPQDGMYELIVQSADKTGNNSSSTDNRLTDQVYYDYKISFEVENQSRISNVLNYPNPFTTRTQFIFTLSGSEIPTNFDIQILNIKGTVVKQISMAEFGPIHIGLNKSEYWWDGKDDYGDPLANGVYFYRVRSSIDNERIDHYNIDQADKFFEKGLGKMVLIR